MRKRVITAINNMRIEGKKPTEIANTLGISVNTVKSHIRRHPDIPGTLCCLYCGKPVMQTPGRKAKKYCSDQCRTSYWNAYNRERRISHEAKNGNA